MKNIIITPQKPRRGFSLLELIVALILLGTVTTIVVPALGWMSAQNRLSLQRQEAVQGLGNLMDGLTSRPYEELTPETAAKVELPEALKRQLPGATLKVEITQAEPNLKRIRAVEIGDAELHAKRIEMQLGWNQRNGQPLAPLRLSAWVHEREGNR